MEIVQERLDREFDMNVITTVPNVSYNIYDKQGNMKEVHNPGGMPDPTLIDHIEEPYIKSVYYYDYRLYRPDYDPLSGETWRTLETRVYFR